MKPAVLIASGDVVGYAGQWRTVAVTRTDHGPLGGVAVIVTWEEGGLARFPAGDLLFVRPADGADDQPPRA